ncbi:MAG: methyltransferase domain-containing protein [Anaerolineales bacterium]|jgi:ubiquinone/menaquinone biosynthesis C-methylase UbiE
MSFFSRIFQEIQYFVQPTWTFEQVGAHWDGTQEYDDINEETYSYFRRFIDGLRLSDLKENGIVLDFCSRTGNGTTYFFEKGKVKSAVCMDVSYRMGQICIERATSVGLSDVIWIPLADYTFPLNDEAFDSVLCYETVEHFAHPEKLLFEIGRVIKTGGYLILTTPNILWEPIHAIAAILRLHHSEGPHRFIRYPRLKKMIRSAGFEIQAVETTVLIPAGPKQLIRLGEWIEEKTRRWLMPLLGLRRVIIARKI